MAEGVPAYSRGDYATALQQSRPLAELGHAEAQWLLAGMYYRGEGAPQDSKERDKWIGLAAEGGNALAKIQIGSRHLNGFGVPTNYKEAVKWYTISAEQGMISVGINLGQVYEKQHRFFLAHMCFNVAAAKGCKSAKEGRDRVKKMITIAEILKAQALALECVKKNYKRC